MTLDPAPLVPPRSRTQDWRSILQVVFSFLGVVIFLGQGIIMLAMDLFSASTAGQFLGGSAAIPVSGSSGVNTSFGVISIVMALLLIPSGVTAVARTQRARFTCLAKV